jgi:hypothetical protein
MSTCDCGAVIERRRMYCPACGVMIRWDREPVRHADCDSVDGLDRSFGARIDDWLPRDPDEDEVFEEYEDMVAHTFQRGAEGMEL